LARAPRSGRGFGAYPKALSQRLPPHAYERGDNGDSEDRSDTEPALGLHFSPTGFFSRGLGRVSVEIPKSRSTPQRPLLPKKPADCCEVAFTISVSRRRPSPGAGRLRGGRSDGPTRTNDRGAFTRLVSPAHETGGKRAYSIPSAPSPGNRRSRDWSPDTPHPWLAPPSVQAGLC
jgi:hypothetical protein